MKCILCGEVEMLGESVACDECDAFVYSLGYESYLKRARAEEFQALGRAAYVAMRRANVLDVQGFVVAA